VADALDELVHSNEGAGLRQSVVYLHGSIVIGVGQFAAETASLRHLVFVR